MGDPFVMFDGRAFNGGELCFSLAVVFYELFSDRILDTAISML